MHMAERGVTTTADSVRGTTWRWPLLGQSSLLWIFVLDLTIVTRADQLMNTWVASFW
jgi:hypothetical protein